MQNIWPVLLPISEAVAMVLAARVLLHYFQLESYQFQGYFKTVGRQWRRAFLPGLKLNAAYVLCIFVLFGLLNAESFFFLPLAAVQIVFGFLLFRQAENQRKLEETEMAWLEKSQELENKQKELELS